MPVETELKLRIAPEHLARLKRHALFKSLSVARPVMQRLHNIYYDTPKLELHKTGMALRLRRAGNHWLQTLKGGGSVEAGLHRRNEWEVPVRSAKLDFSFPGVEEWNEHLPPALRKKLQPVFVTDFTRSSRMLRYQGAEIELCIDQGEVRAGERSAAICELELELKSGEPRQLFELALAILDVVPFELEAVSKAERGYRLLSDIDDKPVKAMLPDIDIADKLSDVLQRLIWSCLQHLQANLSGAMHSEDAEYLHQMRVALRRLRVVLRMTEKFRADGELAALSKEVADLCNALGRIREWDVFIVQVARPVYEQMHGRRGMKAMLSACERLRSERYTALRTDSKLRELQRLLLRFSIWMSGAYWQQRDENTAVLARDFALHRLNKLAKRFSQADANLEMADAPQLHALRILAKKLRYSAEFFSGLYGRTKAKPYLSALSAVQDVLGEINDDTVAYRLLKELEKNAALSVHQDVIELTRDRVARGSSRRFRELRKKMQRFEKQTPLWLK